MRLLALLVMLVLFAGMTATPAGATQAANSTAEDAQIVDLYPNPPTYGDEGEFVTVSLPPETNLTAYTLADDHVEVPLFEEPPPTAAGNEPITFSTNTTVTTEYTTRTVSPLSDRIQLADRGDTVRLRYRGETVDKVTYGRATEAEVYNTSREQWQALNATTKPITTAEGGSVETFVLPDESGRAVEFLEASEERIYLAGYTISSQRVVDTLIEAHERGVDVEVLADGSPVGGMGGETAAALDSLDRAGIDVRVIGGDRARYRFHHAKYAVVDDRALVTTENWKPSGTGGQSSRGWAAITDQKPIVSGLVNTFQADTGWVDAIPWDEYDDATIVSSEPARGSYPTEFSAESMQVDRTELLLAPDNAEDRILELIDDAEETLEIKQVRIGDRQLPFLQAVLHAADRGVEVRILLDSTWYVEEENRQLKRWLEEQAAAEDLPLEVRLVDPDDEFEKIHAKGVVVDDEKALVGSINWNNNSVRNNREAALLIGGTEAATYYREVFDEDWQAEEDRELPLGLALAALFVAVLAILGGTRLRFDAGKNDLFSEERL